MIAPRIFGFLAVAALLVASVFGRRQLRSDAGLRKAIGALLFCAIAGLTTSYIRAPVIIWSLAVLMLAAMVFLVWTMHVERGKRA